MGFHPRRRLLAAAARAGTCTFGGGEGWWHTDAVGGRPPCTQLGQSPRYQRVTGLGQLQSKRSTGFSD
jgi:hypothetical protein